MSIAALVKSIFMPEERRETWSKIWSTDYSSTGYFATYAINFALITSPLELIHYYETMMANLGVLSDCCCQRCGCCGTKCDCYGTGMPRPCDM